MLNVKIEPVQTAKLVVGKLKLANSGNFLFVDSLGNEIFKLDLGGAVDKFDDEDIVSVTPDGLVRKRRFK